MVTVTLLSYNRLLAQLASAALAAWLSLAFSKAAVVLQSFDKPLAPNTKGYVGDNGSGYIVGGVVHTFFWMPVPAALDLDADGTTDITFDGWRPPLTSATVIMTVTQHGPNQVWARAGGVAGNDFGSVAVAFVGGTPIGPGLTSQNAQVGWHNNDNTRWDSKLMEAEYGTSRPADGEFLPSFPFEVKYLAVRFERAGAIHYGWIAISGYANIGQELFIHAWAYESEPGRGLITGQVPEPTTALMVLVGGAIVGFRRVRFPRSGFQVLAASRTSRRIRRRRRSNLNSSFSPAADGLKRSRRKRKSAFAW